MSRVIMRISTAGLLRALRLPDEVEIVTAGAESGFSCLPGQPRMNALVLTVDIPDAPGGAAEAIAEYTDTGHRDPVELTRWHWYSADGAEIGTPAEAAEAAS